MNICVGKFAVFAFTMVKTGAYAQEECSLKKKKGTIARIGFFCS